MSTSNESGAPSFSSADVPANDSPVPAIVKERRLVLLRVKHHAKRLELPSDILSVSCVNVAAGVAGRVDDLKRIESATGGTRAGNADVDLIQHLN